MSNENDSGNDRYDFVSTDLDFEQRSLDAIPKNTQLRNKWAVNTFSYWATRRNNNRLNTDKVLTTVEGMEDAQLSFWLSRFVIEVRKTSGDFYPPSSLFPIVKGIQFHIRLTTKRSVDFLSPNFEDFRQVFDGELKRLSNLGIGHTKRQAEPITDDEEEMLLKCKLLGDFNPRVLVNTMLYLNGKHFALRSGAEHRNIRFRQSQITLVEPASGPAFLRYKEDISKTCQGGLKHRKITPKIVDHYANTACKERCHVQLYKKYMALSPDTGRDDAFYLTPLQRPTDKCWFSRQAIGHNTLQKVVPDLCKKGGISGHKTNHSLRVTTATKLYEKGVPEQLIMERTGHMCVEGCRNYKRTSDSHKMEVSAVLNTSPTDADRDSGQKSNVTSPNKSDIPRKTGPSLAELPGIISASNCTINVIFKE